MLLWCAGSLLLYILYCYKFLMMKKVPYLKLPFPYIHVRFPRNQNSKWCSKLFPDTMDMTKYYADMKKRGYKIAGVVTCGVPVLIVRDLKYINKIFKDFSYFDDRGYHWTERNYDPVTDESVYLDEKNWVAMVGKLSPTTMPDKINTMIPAVLECSRYLVEAIDKCVIDECDFDIREFLDCFTATFMVLYIYRLKVDGFKDRLSRFAFEKINFLVNNQNVAAILGLGVTNEDMARYLYKIMSTCMKYHETNSFENMNFLGLNLYVNNWLKSSGKHSFFCDMTFRSSMLFYHSFDTSSTIANFAIYELCENPDIQEKLRDEIMGYEGEITWEAVSQMKYLSKVVYETLRMYPPAANLIKVATEDYELQDADITVGKRTEVIIPLFCLHRDADYYPDPNRFDPQRFDNDNSHPFYMPFGGGFTNGTSLQATLLMAKLVLVILLRNFRFRISPRTEMPLKIDPKTFLRSTEMFIVAEKI